MELKLHKNIAQELCKICSKINVDEVDYNKEFLEYGVSSIEFIQLLVNLENNYDFEFEDEYLDIGKMNSISAIASYITQHITNINI